MPDYPSHVGLAEKLAISGKGGAGKSTLAAALASLLAQKHHTVLAVDADPDANLAAALGMSLQQRKKPVGPQAFVAEISLG